VVQIAREQPETKSGSQPESKPANAVPDEAPQDAAVASDGPSWIDTVRDPRRSAASPRRQELLLREIEGLERLAKRAVKNDPTRPQLLRRIAETLVELRYAARRQRLRAESLQDGPEALEAKKLEARANRRAVTYYTALITSYPKYAKLDEALYYLAYEHEQRGDASNARKRYFELIEKAPQSPHVPGAFLAFGELFREEARADPRKWALAEGAYREVTRYPAPQNRLACFAHYRLVEVCAERERSAEERAARDDALSCAELHAELRGSDEIRAALEL
jgi:hypothetical protein